MSFDAWVVTFQDLRLAARAAFDHVQQLLKENAELREAAQWHGANQQPDSDILVLVETSDNEVYPGYLDGDVWRYADGMPVSILEVVAWRYMPAPHKRTVS